MGSRVTLWVWGTLRNSSPKSFPSRYREAEAAAAEHSSENNSILHGLPFRLGFMIQWTGAARCPGKIGNGPEAPEGRLSPGEAGLAPVEGRDAAQADFCAAGGSPVR